MAFRKFDTRTWQDPWFENLSEKAKLLFIYLWTNETCSQAGMYQITKKRILFDCGIDINEYCEEISEKVVWNKNENIVWIKNFFKHQCQNEKFAIAAINSIQCLPSKYIKLFQDYYHILLTGYHIDTISIPSARETETEKKQNSSETKKIYSPTSEEVRLSTLLLSLILERKLNFKKPDIQKWCVPIDMLLRIDKRTPQQVEEVIRWCQQDNFWQGNILSTGNLRDKIDRLEEQMNRKPSYNKQSIKRHSEKYSNGTVI